MLREFLMSNLNLFICLMMLGIFYIIICIIIKDVINPDKLYDGVLRINTTDPEKDVYRIELNDLLPVDKNELILKIINEDKEKTND